MKKYQLKRKSMSNYSKNSQMQAQNKQNDCLKFKKKTENFNTFMNCDKKQQESRIHLNKSLKNKDINLEKKQQEAKQYRFKAISFVNTHKNSKNTCFITPRNNKQKTVKKPQMKKRHLIERFFNVWRNLFKVKRKCFIFDELSYSQMMILLHQLGYITKDSEKKYNVAFQKQKSQLKKIFQIWNYLTTQDKNVRLISLVVFLSIIEDIQIDHPQIQERVNDFQTEMYTTYAIQTNTQSNSKTPQNVFLLTQHMNRCRNKQVILLDAQIKRSIFKEFQSFRINRISRNSQNALYLKNIQNQTQNPITSLLSPKSIELASTYRKQLFKKLKSQNQQMKQNLDVFDLLAYRKKQVYSNKDKIHQKIQIDTKTINLKDYREKLNQLSSPKFNYQKTSDQIIYEKQKQEYTFHPVISKPKIIINPSKSEIKDLQKIAIRMKTARDIKEDKQNLLKKGWACKKPNIKIEKDKKMLTQLKKEKQLQNQRRNTLKLQQDEDMVIFGKEYEFNRIQLIQSKQLTNSTQFKQISQQSNQKNSFSQLHILQNQEAQSDVEQIKNTFDEQSTQEEVKRTITNYLKIPILYVDVNIQQGKKQRIIIFQDNDPKELAENFGKKHNLPQQTVLRLQEMLIQQIGTILVRIDEETDQDCSFL